VSIKDLFFAILFALISGFVNESGGWVLSSRERGLRPFEALEAENAVSASLLLRAVCNRRLPAQDSVFGGLLPCFPAGGLSEPFDLGRW